MSIHELDIEGRPAVADIEESLNRMMGRLRSILAAPVLTERGMVEMMSIYNNVAYVFLYLDAVDDNATANRLRPLRGQFYDDEALNRAILAKLCVLRCADPEAEASRSDYIQKLEESGRGGADHAHDIEGHLDRAKAILDRRDGERRALISRLGVGNFTGRAESAFYQLSSLTEKAERRRKLALVWGTCTSRHSVELADIVDEMVTVRRRRCAEAGFDSVLQQTMSRCRVSKVQVSHFLDEFLGTALQRFEALVDEIESSVGTDSQPLDHFGYLLKSGIRSIPPLYSLDKCMSYIFRVAESVFGITLRWTEGTSDEIMVAHVSQEGRKVGSIKFDLWDLDRKSFAANHTRGIRNRTNWGGIEQRPVAYVSCRFRRGADGIGRITFQNVHSIFHEFGHAVNHLLVRKRISYFSGLEYLPPERLELLSMFFEKWVFHADFADYAGDHSDGSGLAMCRDIAKLEYRRTYAERAVTAMLDFRVHGSNEGSLKSHYDAIDSQYGIARHVRFDDIVEYFTWPMYVSNPGANFTYLWGAARSLEMFRPFQDSTLDQIAASGPHSEAFASCFDFGMTSEIPAVDHVFVFYDSATLEGLAT
ncbi:M3 family metallopeptidase [Nocardia sp. NPDC047648]|uniref:M3 family metallopeptidase n=1 Tax=Nocardia sp. NPDC047648 TaxID=3155625 RepID=UPI00340B9A0B